MSELTAELDKMQTGDRIASDGVGFLKVPHGWVIEYWEEDRVTSCCFIPDLSPKKKSILV